MITTLSVKPERYKPMVEVNRIVVTPSGIEGNVQCALFRQVLIVPKQTLRDFSLEPGDLRENAIVDMATDLHELESGTVIQIGAVRIRLTFHCEPCKVISSKVSPRAIMHRRGVLGQFLGSGVIAVGDQVKVLGVEFEPIPYSIPDRLVWCLDRQREPVTLVRLLDHTGLSKSYARAIATMVRKLPLDYQRKVIIKADGVNPDDVGQGVLSL